MIEWVWKPKYHDLVITTIELLPFGPMFLFWL